MKTKYKGIIIPDYLIAMKWIKKGNKCATDLYKELNITYKHLHELKHTFIALDWITIEKQERRHVMHITDKGLEVVDVIDKLLNIMNINEKNIKEYIESGKLNDNKNVDIKKLEHDMRDAASDNDELFFDDEGE